MFVIRTLLSLLILFMSQLRCQVYDIYRTFSLANILRTIICFCGTWFVTFRSYNRQLWHILVRSVQKPESACPSFHWVLVPTPEGMSRLNWPQWLVAYYDVPVLTRTQGRAICWSRPVHFH